MSITVWGFIVLAVILFVYLAQVILRLNTTLTIMKSISGVVGTEIPGFFPPVIFAEKMTKHEGQNRNSLTCIADYLVIHVNPELPFAAMQTVGSTIRVCFNHHWTNHVFCYAGNGSFVIGLPTSGFEEHHANQIKKAVASALLREFRIEHAHLIQIDAYSSLWAFSENITQ
jgi:hypothetical protein